MTSTIQKPELKDHKFDISDTEGKLIMLSSNSENIIHRGLVYFNDIFISQSLPYTIETFNVIEFKKCVEKYNISDLFFFPSYEGTLLRMFNFEQKWYLTTNRCFNANRSRWGSDKSFGFMFDEALLNFGFNNRSSFESTLDDSKQYFFLLCSTDKNRIVCNFFKKQHIFHIGTVINDTINFDIEIGIERPSQLKFETFDEIQKFVNECDPFKNQGLICFVPDGRQIKIFNTEYRKLCNVRNNEPSIKFRYLQIRNNQEQIDSLKALYPEMIIEFDKYEKILDNISHIYYKAYVNRYIYHNFIDLPNHEFFIIKKVRGLYKTLKTNNIIGLIRNVLREQSAVFLNQLIKENITQNLEKVF